MPLFPCERFNKRGHTERGHRRTIVDFGEVVSAIRMAGPGAGDDHNRASFAFDIDADNPSATPWVGKCQVAARHLQRAKGCGHYGEITC